MTLLIGCYSDRMQPISPVKTGLKKCERTGSSNSGQTVHPCIGWGCQRLSRKTPFSTAGHNDETEANLVAMPGLSACGTHRQAELRWHVPTRRAGWRRDGRVDRQRPTTGRTRTGTDRTSISLSPRPWAISGFCGLGPTGFYGLTPIAILCRRFAAESWVQLISRTQ